jgi:hypothetical protein
MKLKLETELQITESNAAELRGMLRRFDEQRVMKPMPIRERWDNHGWTKYRNFTGNKVQESNQHTVGRVLIIANATNTEGDEKRILATAQLANACKLAGGEWMKVTSGERWVMRRSLSGAGWCIISAISDYFALMAFKTKEQAESVSSAPDFSELMAIAFPITEIK